MTNVIIIIALIAVSWAIVGWVASLKTRNPHSQKLLDIAVPALFGIAMLLLWEVTVRLFAVPQVLLPAPSVIWARITSSIPILWADFQQTFLKAVIIGYVAGAVWASSPPLSLTVCHSCAKDCYHLKSRCRTPHCRRRANHGDVVRL